MKKISISIPVKKELPKIVEVKKEVKQVKKPLEVKKVVREPKQKVNYNPYSSASEDKSSVTEVVDVSIS